MLKSVPALQLIVLHAPYETLTHDLTPKLFTDLLKLKLQGYQKVYRPGVLPIDTYDYISTHLLIGFPTEQGLDIQMGFRSTVMGRCDFHNTKFPGLAVLDNSGATEHSKRLNSLMQNWRATDQVVSYTSSWTIRPEVRDHPELKALLREMAAGFHVLREIELGSDQRVACGAPKMKTDQIFLQNSYRRLESETGSELPIFKQSSLLGEEAVILHSDQLNDAAYASADKIRSYWEKRIVIGQESFGKSAIGDQKKAA